MSSRLIAIVSGIFLLGQTLANEVYQEPTAFINKVFNGQPPAPAVVWISGETREQIQTILQHRPATLRIRYWQQGLRSAWVMEEIGKEKPITVGIVINQSRVEQIRVLVFRESRGWEVRYPFFTDQFKQARLNEDLQLDRPIDGITGATLSVRALTRLARVALYLHDKVNMTP